MESHLIQMISVVHPLEHPILFLIYQKRIHFHLILSFAVQRLGRGYGYQISFLAF